MCKSVITILFALLLITSSFSVLSAQTPFIAVYFDQALQQESATCPLAPPGTVLQQLYIAGVNFNTLIHGVEFRVSYPPELLWIGEIYPHPNAGIAVGSTPTGLALTYFAPWADGTSAFMIAEVTIQWQCSSCTGNTNVGVSVVQHPNGFLRGQEAVTFTDIPAVGLTALICPTVPVEETTWGNVKALYE